jgi:hypothetical protein
MSARLFMSAIRGDVRGGLAMKQSVLRARLRPMSLMVKPCKRTPSMYAHSARCAVALSQRAKPGRRVNGKLSGICIGLGRICCCNMTRRKYLLSALIHRIRQPLPCEHMAGVHASSQVLGAGGQLRREAKRWSLQDRIEEYRRGMVGAEQCNVLPCSQYKPQRSSDECTTVTGLLAHALLSCRVCP